MTAVPAYCLTVILSMIANKNVAPKVERNGVRFLLMSLKLVDR